MNLCEAIESGKRYNRAIRSAIWPEEVYVYADREGRLLMSETAEGKKNEPVRIGEEDLANAQWELSRKAPYYGPAGVLTRERAEGLINSVFVDVGSEPPPDELLDALTAAMMQIGNGTIAFVEEQKQSDT